MKVLFVLSLFAAFSSSALAGVVKSKEAGKAHCTKLVGDDKKIQQNLYQNAKAKHVAEKAS